MTEEDAAFALPATSHVGRVALRVGSIDRLVPFYRDAIGCRVARDGRRARLVADGTTLIELREDPDAPERGRSEAGLFHFAIRVPDRAALGDVLARIGDSDAELTGASDHLVSEALYLRDPEGNGVEVYRDRPREEWPRGEDGGVEMDTLPLDLDDLRAAAGGGEGLPAGTDVGHVHLEVTALSRSEAFYAGTLGLGVRARYGNDAAFLAAGDYHHHVGLNVWKRRSEPAAGSRGLSWFELVLPDDALEAVRERLEDRGAPVETRPDGFAATDPDGIEVRISVDG